MQLTVKKPLRKYEAIVIMHPDASEDEAKQLFRRNQEIIKRFAGNVNHLDTWGKRRLANPIEKIKIGTYFHSTFEASAEAVEELERTMRINEQVLRFLHVRLDDRISTKQFVEEYRELIKQSMQREAEREAKHQAKKAAMSAKRAMRPFREG